MLADVLRHEWLVLRRSRLAVLMAVLYAVFVFACFGPKLGTATHFDTLHRLSAFVTLPMLLLGAHLTQRDRADRFTEIQAVLPAGNAVVVGGRLAIGAGVALAAALVQTFTVALYSATRGAPLHLFVRALAGVGTLTALNFVCAVAIGFAIGTFAGRRTALVLTAVTWLSAFAIGIFGAAPRVQWIRIFDFSGAWGLTPSDMWGFGPDRRLQMVKAAFILAVAGVVALCALQTVERRRPSGLRRIGPRALACLLVVVLLAGPVVYYRATAARVDAARHDDGIELAVEIAPLFRVTDYDLAVDLIGNELRVTAELTIANASDRELTELPLTLRDSLAIAQVTWAGQAVTSQRKDHWLTLHLPKPLPVGSTGRLQLTYGGELAGLQVVNNNFIGTPRMFGVGNGFAYLPYAAAWYPVAGHWRCLRGGQPRTGMMPHAPAAFRMRVSSSRLALQSNLPATDATTFTGQGYTGVYLLGAPTLAVTAQPGVRLTHDTVAAQDESLAALLGDGVRLASLYLPGRTVEDVDVLIMPVPLASDQFPPAPPSENGMMVLALSERAVNIAAVHRAELVSVPVMSRLVAQTVAPGVGVDAIAPSFGVSSWLAARVGDSLGLVDYASLTRQFERLLAAQPTDAMARIYLSLDEIDRHGGPAAVRGALQPLRERPELPADELAFALESFLSGGEPR